MTEALAKKIIEGNLPIMINNQLMLIDGLARLKAHIFLGIKEIEVKIIELEKH